MLVTSNPSSYHHGVKPSNRDRRTIFRKSPMTSLESLTTQNDKSVVYLFDERIGPKNTDHTLSFLTHFWNQLHHQHPWIHRLAIFLDNAISTNKNKYLFSWAMEMVSSGEIDHVHISLMVAGHTKFAPDRLFSVTGSARRCVHYT